MSESKVSPALTEKQALEKASGQSPQQESEKDSKPDIQQLAQEISVAELFEISIKKSAEMKEVNADITDLKTRKSNLLREKEEIDSELKPESRERKKIPGIGKQNPPDRTKRKNLRARRKWIIRQLFLTGEDLEAKEKRLSQLTGSSIKSDERGLLYDKANADNYLRKNQHLIRAKMLKAINLFRENSDPATISKIRTLARSSHPDRTILFKQEFGKILEEIDESTYILCSGLLSNTLYEAARLTLLSVGPSFDGKIELLVLPVE